VPSVLSVLSVLSGGLFGQRLPGATGRGMLIKVKDRPQQA
jgi:hypothetical protein